MNLLNPYSKLLVCISLLIASFHVTAYGQYKSENLFYMVNNEASFQSFKNNIKQISIAAPQSFSMTKDGIIYGHVDPRIIKLAKDHNVKVMPLVVNIGFDQQLMQSFLKDEVAQQRAIEMMVQLAKKHGFYGWQFDYEGMHFTDRQAFTDYYRKAAKALHKAGFKISVAVIPYDSDYEFPTRYHEFWYRDWRGVYDFKALAQYGDFISLMTYLQHHNETAPPGPVAGLPWMKDMVTYLIDQGIKPNKISLGIGFFSAYWYADYNKIRGGFINGKEISYEMAIGMVKQNNAELNWMEKQQVNYAYWTTGGIFEWVFLEDSASLGPELDLLKKFQLRGISVWVLGREDPAVWEVIRTKLDPILNN